MAGPRSNEVLAVTFNCHTPAPGFTKNMCHSGDGALSVTDSSPSMHSIEAAIITRWSRKWNKNNSFHWFQPIRRVMAGKVKGNDAT